MPWRPTSRGRSRPKRTSGVCSAGQCHRGGELPGRQPVAASGTSCGAGRFDNPGLRHADQRQPRQHGAASRSTPTPRATASTSTAWATTAAPGARKVATVMPSATLPQNQPACLNDAATGLVDCGNWARFRLLGRPGDCRLRHLFRQARAAPTPVAPATSSSSCATMQARRTCCSRRPTPPGRPTTTTAATACTRVRRRGAPTRSATTGRSPRAATNDSRAYFFGAEYPMVRWLEANGYDVSYCRRRRCRAQRRR